MTSGNQDGLGLQSRLRRELAAALRAHDQVAVAALRTALSALANAEAVPAPVTPPGGSASPGSASPSSGSHVAGTAPGLGAAEAERRHIGAAEAQRIVRAEISERLTAADQYERAGHADRAARLRREAAVLSGVAGEPA